MDKSESLEVNANEILRNIGSDRKARAEENTVFVGGPEDPEVRRKLKLHTHEDITVEFV